MYKDYSPDIFNELIQAWLTARPIKTSFDKVKEILISKEEIQKKINDAKESILFPGEIFSIYSEKKRHGMGKSQFAYFLKEEFEKNERSLTIYHVLSPSEEGFEKLKISLRKSLNKCSNRNHFYFFIDEIDLLFKPDMTEEEESKIIDHLSNILIEISEKASSSRLPFRIFLVLSRRALDKIEEYSSDRFARRTEDLTAIDLSFEKDDIESFAVNFFAVLWVSNYHNIQEKVKNSSDFYSLINDMINDMMNNLMFLNLDTNTSTIGYIILFFKRIFGIIFRDIKGNMLRVVRDTIVERISLGNSLEVVMKDYLLSRSKKFEFVFENNLVLAEYLKDEYPIGDYKTDGHFDFKISDNQIGIMPIEIATGETLRKRKKKQLRAFTNKYPTLFVWFYKKRKESEEEIDKLDSKVTEDIHRILIPKDLAKYVLLVNERKYDLLDRFRGNISKDIETFLHRYALTLFNQWMMARTIKKGKKATGEPQITLHEIQEITDRFLRNVFTYLNDKSSRWHKNMKDQMKKQMVHFNKSFREFEVEINTSEIDTIYREIIEILASINFCSYTEIEPNNHLTKQESFDVEEAIGFCRQIISNRIKDKLKEKRVITEESSIFSY